MLSLTAGSWGRDGEGKRGRKEGGKRPGVEEGKRWEEQEVKSTWDMAVNLSKCLFEVSSFVILLLNTHRNLFSKTIKLKLFQPWQCTNTACPENKAQADR